MTTKRYERVQQRDANRLRLEEDEESVPPLDCSGCASYITDDIETYDNVVHAALVVNMLTLSRAKEAAALSSGETGNNIRYSDSKQFAFKEKILSVADIRNMEDLDIVSDAIVLPSDY